jgi:hypothetical protein
MRNFALAIFPGTKYALGLQIRLHLAAITCVNSVRANPERNYSVGDFGDYREPVASKSGSLNNFVVLTEVSVQGEFTLFDNNGAYHEPACCEVRIAE